MKKVLKHFSSADEGATALEYGLMVAIFSVALVAAMRLMSGEILNTFNTATQTLSNAIPK